MLEDTGWPTAEFQPSFPGRPPAHLFRLPVTPELAAAHFDLLQIDREVRDVTISGVPTMSIGAPPQPSPFR